MKLKKSHKKDVFRHIDLQKDDIILYMGGRIDDDKLYPKQYSRYLKNKIEQLNPSKIICHNHWYAKKYYEKGILSKSTKIDMILVHYPYLSGSRLQTINPIEYNNHYEWIKILIDKNPNIVYAIYQNQGRLRPTPPTSVDIDDNWFTKDYDLNNVKYFCCNRVYSPRYLVEEDLGHGLEPRNASDGFVIISLLLKFGFKNLNIVGFSSFGSDEDMSYHSEYNCDGDSRFLGRKLFNLNTSEDLRAESDILKHWTQTKKIKTIEDYSKLMSYLKEIQSATNNKRHFR